MAAKISVSASGRARPAATVSSVCGRADSARPGRRSGTGRCNPAGRAVRTRRPPVSSNRSISPAAARVDVRRQIHPAPPVRSAVVAGPRSPPPAGFPLPRQLDLGIAWDAKQASINSMPGNSLSALCRIRSSKRRKRRSPGAASALRQVRPRRQHGRNLDPHRHVFLGVRVAQDGNPSWSIDST